MINTFKAMAVIGFCLVLAGCASLKDRVAGSGADAVCAAFFEDIQRGHRQEAYGFFAKGLSQTVAYDQFEGLLAALKDQWGRLQSAQTAEMPFHRRLGEGNFIPLHMPEDQIKRYVYEVQFENAAINWDLTLSPQDGQYKIIWMSLWGSTNYFTQDIRDKIAGLFGAGQEETP